MSLWILKFTKDGGVYAAEEQPSRVLPSAVDSARGQAAPAATSSRKPRQVSNRVDVSDHGAQQTLQPLEVGDFVLARGKRARIRNIFLSQSQSYLAQLFFIDTAEDGTAPLHHLSLLPETLMEDPPLAQYFTLSGISPHIPTEPAQTPSRVKQTLTKCVGRVTAFQPQMWPTFAMNILKTVSGCSGDRDEVKVRVEMCPGDEIVIHCNTTEGELNFNQYLVTVNFAVVRQPPKVIHSTGHLPSPEQLMCALQNISQLRVDYQEAEEMPTTSRPVKPVRKTGSKPVAREVEEEPIPYTYLKVYVESVLTTRPSVSLEGAGFPGSVCKTLTRLGFQTPTPAQAATWPILRQGRGLTIIVSPPNSGKTLAYLLPLVTSREVSHPRVDVPHPRLVVVVRSSWGVQAVHTRAVELMSAQSAHRRFRACAAYKAQGKAIVQVLSGVEVLVCTPGCLLQLVEKAVAQLDSLVYLVLDDFEKLQKNFTTEISKILGLCSSSTCSGPVGVVVTTSQWSETVAAVPSLISNHTHLCCSPTHLVITCPIEATIRAKIKMCVIPCLEQSPDSILRKQLSETGGPTVVCVATAETADGVLHNLYRQCLSVAMVKEGERRSVRELFKKHAVVVVTDSVLPLLIETGRPLVSHIIHHELPTNRKAFTNRLTLLYPAIHKGVSCRHSIFLTERWRRQASLLKEMVVRMDQTPPQPLLDMANQLTQAEEEKRKEYDLCYQLKAWGVCSESSCSYRHIHSSSSSSSSFPSPQPLELPKDGSIKVIVRYCSTATRWWVSLLGHAPLYRGAEPVQPHDSDGLLKMSFQLAKYFTSDKQRNVLHSVPPEGNYCALRDRDGSFYRVRILRFSQPLEFMFHHHEKALVRLIDIGEARVVDVSQLLELPQHLLAPPANVFEIFVCRTKPADSDPDWPPEAAGMMEQEYRNQTVHGRVALVSGETVWLHPVEKKVHHKVSNIVAALTSPQQQLKDAKMGESNPQHLVNLANCLGLPLVRAENIVTIDDPCVSFASLKNEKGECVDVCVSAVDSPNRFYLQPMATESRVIELENSLNQYEGVCSMAVQRLPVGSVCAAQFSENSSWYRGCVLEVEGHESKIRFLDYGNVEWVMNHLVQPIHPGLLELPFQAICATFGMNNTEWGAEAGNLLYEWTREMVLIAKVESVAPSSSKILEGPECATVELFEKSSSCSSSERGTSIALRLPGARPAVDEPQHSVCREVNSDLETLCLTLSNDQPLDEKEAIAMAIRNAVLNKPGLCVGGRVLELLCRVVCDTPPSVSIPLLETLRVLSSFHTKVGLELSLDSCLSHLLQLLQNTSSQAVLSQTLGLMVCLLKHTTSSSLLSTTVALETFMGVFRNHGNSRVAKQRQDILKPLILLLYHITTSTQQFLRLSVSQGVVPLLCDWLTESINLPPTSYYHCLVKDVLFMLEGVAKIPHHCGEVSQSLSLETLNSHLLSSDEFAHPVLKLLVTLSVLPEFASKLHGSVLLKTVFKLSVTSAVTRVLLCALKQNVKPGETRCATVVENGDHHFTSSANECKDGGKLRPPLSEKPTALVARTVAQTSKAVVLHPHVLWSQRDETVLLAVQLRGCREDHTTSNFSQTAVKFMTSVWEQDYQFSVELHASIKPEVCSMTLTGSEVLLKLVKAVPGAWPRLTHGNQKPVHISIDFNRWQDKEVGVLGASGSKPAWSVPAASKMASYVNPVLTDSDLDAETGSDSEDGDEEEEEELGRQAWQDDLDFGF